MYNALWNTSHSSSKVLRSFKLKTATLLLIPNSSDLVFWNNNQACLFFYLTVFKILKNAIHFNITLSTLINGSLNLWGQNFHTSIVNFIILLKCRVESLELGQIFNKYFLKEGQTTAEYWKTFICNILYILKYWIMGFKYWIVFFPGWELPPPGKSSLSK